MLDYEHGGPTMVAMTTMGASSSSAREVVARLEALRSDEELATVRKRLA